MPPSGAVRPARPQGLSALAVLFGWLVATVAGAEEAPPLSNALRDHPSPYLAMHAADPVAWQDWSGAVLERARAENRPIFISSGYFACHWCHVMQRESFRNPEIAALLNRAFIPVKLDRELYPALDERLIRFTERTSGQAGWPLNVILTPEGYPLLGLTYLPPERFGLVLREMRQLWAEDPERLARLAREAAQALEASPIPPDPGTSPSPGDLAGRLKAQALALGDELQGGFGDQARFPMEPNLAVLLELQARRPDPALAGLLRLTLEQIARRGLHDALGGGFFRYTVDPDWQTPHFEKMLYTQALMVPLYLRAAELLEQPVYREVARETLEFTLREMRGPAGGFIASLSAVDDQGVEGGYYLWQPADLERWLTPPELALIVRLWGLRGPARFPAGHLPLPAEGLGQAAAALGLSLAEAQALLASSRAKLLEVRGKRGLPKDEKVLAGWNGLMLTALAEGYRAFAEPRFAEAAHAVREVVVGRLWDGTRLLRARSGSGELGEASLEDYAYVAQGLARWAEVVGSPADRELAVRLLGVAWERFYAGGWRLAGRSLLPDVPAEPALEDAPLPSPAAVVIRLSRGLAEAQAAGQVEEAVRRSQAAVSASPFRYASQAWMLIEIGGLEIPR
jgi:uncharacterized protein